MKAINGFLVLALLLTGWMPAFAQAENAEVPGDHFSLEGALELFKKSSSPEDFERMLNSPDAKVNNLDLNGDGYVDYIRVLDRQEGNVHAFILQAVISDYESQDVAVIELEKLANGKAVLQIIGDEDIYGVTTIIEPTDEVRTYAGTRTTSTVVNVWAWPTVQYVYGPRYAVWVSPWSWHVRPVWWRTWRPVTYVHYYSVWHPYRPYYSVCHTRRIVHAHRIYAPYRSTSVIVHNRHHHQIRNYRENYADTRNGRTRNDNRTRFTNDDNSSGRNTGGRTRQDYNVNSRTSLQREATSTTNRPASRERVPVDRNSYRLNDSRTSTQNRSDGNSTRTRTTTPQRTATPGNLNYQNREATQQRQVTRDRQVPQTRTQSAPAQRSTQDFSRRSTAAPTKTQSPASRERQAPATINRSPAPKNNSNFSRNSYSAPAKVERRQQVSRPMSIDRKSQPSPPSRQQGGRSSGKSNDNSGRGR